MLRIAIGSTNPVKIEATRIAIAKIYKNFDVVPVDIKSIVSAFPTSDEEMVKGAIYRARESMKNAKADIGIGLEGGYHCYSWGCFIKAWGAATDGSIIGIGASPAVPIPDELIEIIDPKIDDKSKQSVDSFFGIENLAKKQGIMGAITKGALTRQESLVQAVVSAMGRIISKKVFDGAKTRSL